MSDIKDRVQECVRVIEDKKGEDVKVLNIQGLSPLADYFVIATGNNPNQLHAMCDEIGEVMSKQGIHPKQIEGYQSANWILIDYSDFIIHLFVPEARDFYNLERLWKDAVIE